MKNEEQQEPKQEEQEGPEEHQKESPKETTKIYVTRHGEAYHQTEERHTLKHSQKFERGPCEVCFERVKEMWKEGPASSSHERNMKDLTISSTNQKYHHPSCEELKKCKGHDKRRMCWYCYIENKETNVWNDKTKA